MPPLDSVLYWHRNAEHDPANVWMRERIVEASRHGRAERLPSGAALPRRPGRRDGRLARRRRPRRRGR
ncbi:MAG: hypothetical protein ACREQ9_10405 [Candidatus Binatia bacterium]